MIESIIRRYKLYIPDETYEETFYDTLSFLITKAGHFQADKQKKAYSYYGNICKNYLLGRKDKFVKNSQRNPSYDIEEEEFTNNIKYANTVDKKRKSCI